MSGKSFTIRLKLNLLSVGSSLALFSLVVCFYVLAQHSSKTIKDLFQSASDQDSSFFELIGNVTASQGILQQINREKDPDRIEELAAKYNESIFLVEKLIKDDDEHKKVKAAWEQLKQMNQAILDLILKGRQAIALQKIAYDSNPLLGKLLDEIKADRGQIIAERTEALKKLRSGERSTVVLLFVVAAFLSVGLFVLGFFVNRSVSLNIRKTSGMLQLIASGEGDLTKRLTISSRDELGELASWFNLFVEKLQELIKDIAGTSVTLSSASDELTSLSGEMTNGAQGLSLNSNSVAAASEEMTSNMNSVASAMEEATSNVSMVASSAEQMSLTINEIATNSERARNISEKAVSQVDGATKRVRELGDAAREIDKVTETISDISDQTNLLALNATIEAARAGEHGKGFAVVANEIKELAKQTSMATLDIKNRILGIQQSTSDTVSSIDQISKVMMEIENIISTIASSIEEQSATTKEIATNVAQVSIGLGEVNQNVAQSSHVSAEISKEISNVNVTAAKITDSSRRVNVNADDLSSLAHKLRELVGRFRV